MSQCSMWQGKFLETRLLWILRSSSRLEWSQRLRCCYSTKELISYHAAAVDVVLLLFSVVVLVMECLICVHPFSSTRRGASNVFIYVHTLEVTFSTFYSFEPERQWASELYTWSDKLVWLNLANIAVCLYIMIAYIFLLLTMGCVILSYIHSMQSLKASFHYIEKSNPTF